MNSYYTKHATETKVILKKIVITNQGLINTFIRALLNRILTLNVKQI